MFHINNCEFDVNRRIVSITINFRLDEEPIFIKFDSPFPSKDTEDYMSNFNYNKSEYRIEIEKIINKDDTKETNPTEAGSSNPTSKLLSNNNSRTEKLLLTDIILYETEWTKSKSDNIGDDGKYKVNYDDKYNLRIYLLPQKDVPSQSETVLKILNKNNYTYLSLKDDNGRKELESILLPVKLSHEFSDYNLYLYYFDDIWPFWRNSKDNHSCCSFGLVFPKHIIYKLFAKQSFYFTFDNLSEIEALLTYENYYEPPIFNDNNNTEIISPDFDENILKIKLSILRKSYYCSYIHDVDDNNCLIYFEAENKGVLSKILTEDFIKTKIEQTNQYVFSNIHNNPDYSRNFINQDEVNELDKLASISDGSLDEAEDNEVIQIEIELENMKRYESFNKHYKNIKILLEGNKPLIFSNALTIYNIDEGIYSDYIIKQYKFILPNDLSKNDKRVEDYLKFSNNNFGKHINKNEIVKMRFELEAPQLIDIKFFKHTLKDDLEYQIARYNNLFIFKIENKDYCEPLEKLFNIDLTPISYLNNPKREYYYYCIISNTTPNCIDKEQN